MAHTQNAVTTTCEMCEVEIIGAAFELPRPPHPDIVICKNCALAQTRQAVTANKEQEPHEQIKSEEAGTTQDPARSPGRLLTVTEQAGSKTLTVAPEGGFREADSYPERDPRSGTGREASEKDRRQTHNIEPNPDDDTEWELCAGEHTFCVDCHVDLSSEEWERFRYEEGSRCEPCKTEHDNWQFEFQVFGYAHDPRPLIGVFEHYRLQVATGALSTDEATTHVHEYILERDTRIRP